MNATKIEYLNFTWSPLVGCSGKDCAVYKHCFAKKFKKRNLLKCPECFEFKPHRHFERLNQPLYTKMSRRIGVCFSADFWDEGFDYNDRLPVINVATKANWHWFINLTKHPERIPAYFMFPKNWIQGVTINRKAELQRMNYLKDTHATTKFISFEPLYEDLGNIDLNGIDWIIIGAQTHPDFQPKDEWVERLIYQADNLDIPVFTKNNLPVWNLKEYPYKLAHSPIT